MTGRALLAACVLVLAGCSGAPLATADDPLAAADCEPLEQPQLQEGSHLLGDTAPPVPYSSSPPTSGWHSSGRPLDPGTYVDEVSEPQQVRVLEQGGIVLTYDPDLAADDIDTLQRLPSEVEGLVVTPYSAARAPVTLTAWGVLQRCASVTEADVATFRDAHARVPAH